MGYNSSGRIFVPRPTYIRAKQLSRTKKSMIATYAEFLGNLGQSNLGKTHLSNNEGEYQYDVLHGLLLVEYFVPY